LRTSTPSQPRFRQAALDIDPNKPATEVYRSIQRERPAADKLVSAARDNLDVIRKFLIDY